MRLLLLLSVFLIPYIFGQRLPTISKIPDLPPEYLLRDWNKTAHEFDKLIFDQNRKGEFLPFIWQDNAKTVNNLKGFGLPTYVGDLRQSAKTNLHEAITSMASVLNGALLGIDRSSYAAMLATHFDRKNGVGLYLNQPGTVGGSFWYDLLPSLLFTQIYSHYPETTGFREQFLSTIKKWAEISEQLGTNFDYTGYNFREKKPVNSGWIEADIVAGLACLQYAGWKKTGNDTHLRLAEKCLQWMDQRKINPYYESLAPYGAYASARYNAENNGTHQTGKFIEWVLAGDNPRKWGMIGESWNGIPIHGLIGSVYPEYEYAFAMNTFQAVGIMTPIARYEDHFAKEIAKWVLHVASNARFFYPDSWSPNQQTSYSWAKKNDPAFSIPYEGIRKQGILRRYPENDRMVTGLLRLGHSTNPDKDMFLTADNEGKLKYTGTVELPKATTHSLIVVVRNRKIENNIRFYIKGKNDLEGTFLNKLRDDQKIQFSSEGTIEIVLEAQGLKAGEIIQVQDLVIESRLANPPHVGGDATIHGWAETDLGLYGGSNVGFLASLIEPTNVKGILAVDPVITDILKPGVFPTRIFFNPHPETKSVKWNVGKHPVRIYDAIGNRTLSEKVNGQLTFDIRPKDAVMLVMTPSEKKFKRVRGNLVCDGVVIDFNP